MYVPVDDEAGRERYRLFDCNACRVKVTLTYDRV